MGRISLGILEGLFDSRLRVFREILEKGSFCVSKGFVCVVSLGLFSRKFGIRSGGREICIFCVEKGCVLGFLVRRDLGNCSRFRRELRDISNGLRGMSSRIKLQEC